MRFAVAVMTVFAISVVGASHARAAPNPCFGINDDLPCSDVCVTRGVCVDGVCMPFETAPDGTLCATANFCDGVQECRSGVCTTVAPRVCPDADACHVGRCDPDRGCVLEPICPDGMLSPPPDGGTSPDNNGHDGDRGGPSGTVDGGAPGSTGGSDDPQIRGSNVALFCTIGTFASTPVPTGALLLVALFVAICVSSRVRCRVASARRN